MSTTAMWLLLAVVVIVILFASVLYKRTFTTKELAMTGVMAALSLVAICSSVCRSTAALRSIWQHLHRPDRPAAGRCVRRSGRCHWSGAGRYSGR